MTQAQYLVLMLRIACISGFLCLAGWVTLYTWLAPWWRSPIGRTLVAKSVLIALLLVPMSLSLFFTLNPYLAGWLNVALIGAVTPVMGWRSSVWLRVRDRDADSGAP